MRDLKWNISKLYDSPDLDEEILNKRHKQLSDKRQELESTINELEKTKFEISEQIKEFLKSLSKEERAELLHSLKKE